MIKYFKQWNRWRKRSLNSWFYKILVLFGIAKSPTFELNKAADRWNEELAERLSYLGKCASAMESSFKNLVKSCNDFVEKAEKMGGNLPEE